MTDFIIRNADGSTEGMHPDDLPLDVLRTRHAGGPIMGVIRAKCLDCCCGQIGEVRKCTSAGCPLWPYRMGSNPFHGARGRVPTHGFGRSAPLKTPVNAREKSRDEGGELLR
jgi:hypothetical protein